MKSVLRIASALALAAASLAVGPQGDAQSQDNARVERRISPTDTNPALQRFTNDHYVIFDRAALADAPLVVFMSGTGGRPANHVPMLNFIADRGYRVIGLSYNSTPAVVQACVTDADPACSGAFRARRIFGDMSYGGIDDTAEETIQARLIALLRLLVRDYPNENWDRFLDGDAPRWSEIVVGGASQGAGMAAYIAQRHRVHRVVMFSSPWDFQQIGNDQVLAPWMAGRSVTPPEAWYGAYHRRENAAALLAESYRRLGVPADHVRVFDHELPGGASASSGGGNPYHVVMIHDRSYEADWRFLFGEARR